MARDEGRVGGDGKTSPFGDGMGAPQRAAARPANPMDADGGKSGQVGPSKPGNGLDQASVPPGGAILYADPTTPATKPDGGVDPAQMPFKVSK